ncbi:interferon alpha/beta receptor 2-like isoform X3 [Neoarius graeffei]|uniref:interferon alpha/beta receptor 2-like isoform X3 n=1 Tax=Neoarius graeffei TaxID=443677 RepID=UPI00298C5996|nr:interferon alpha/beta receptor 2-like isoform X3 [Neoarius graeffei]
MNLSRQQRIRRVWTFFFVLIQEVHCSLPSPQNVTIVSFNLEHKLTWTPGPGTAASTYFRVQSCSQKRKLWISVKNCSNLQIGESCDLTKSFKEMFGLYQARMQAFNQDQESNWTTSEFFTPLLDTTLGPPLVSLTGCGNCLLLKLSPPISMEQNHYLHAYFYQEYTVNVSRTRDKAQAAVIPVACAPFPASLFNSDLLLWLVSIIVFWTTVKSAVFPMIVIVCTELD